MLFYLATGLKKLALHTNHHVRLEHLSGLSTVLLNWIQFTESYFKSSIWCVFDSILASKPLPSKGKHSLWSQGAKTEKHIKQRGPCFSDTASWNNFQFPVSVNLQRKRWIFFLSHQFSCPKTWLQKPAYSIHVVTMLWYQEP